jgi:polyisoprenoid-binding protein YceI
MRRMMTSCVATLLVQVSGVSAQMIRDAQVRHGTLAFDAKATLGDFTGSTDSLLGSVRGADRLTGVRGVVEAPTATLSSRNGHRDRDMAKSLEIQKYPLMRYTLDSVSTGAADGDSTAVTLHGAFTIHGETRPAAVDGWVWMWDDSVRFRGATPMDVKDYGIGGLKKMLGVLNMNPHITVRVDVTFGR